MITLLNRRHAAMIFRYVRLGQHLTRRQVAERLFVSPKTLANRERHTSGLSCEDLIDTARVFGYDVALIPARYPHTRPTGTGWPT